jgi:hypothetical protein
MTWTPDLTWTMVLLYRRRSQSMLIHSLSRCVLLYISRRASDVHDCDALPNIPPVFTSSPTTVVIRVRAAFTLWKARVTALRKLCPNTTHIATGTQRWTKSNYRRSWVLADSHVLLEAGSLLRSDVDTCCVLMIYFASGIPPRADFPSLWHWYYNTIVEERLNLHFWGWVCSGMCPMHWQIIG